MKYIILFLLVPFQVFAAHDTLSYSCSAGAQLSDGNIKSNAFNVLMELKGLSNMREWSLNPTYKYQLSYPYPILPTSKPSKQNEFYMSSHISQRIDSNWKIMLFSEVEHSQLRKIDIRFDIGIGPSYRLLKNKHTLLEISCVLLPDFYRSFVVNGYLPERDNLALRLSTRLKFVYKNNNLTFSTVGMIQPPLKTWTFGNDYTDIGWADNINIRSNTAVDISVIKQLSLGIMYEYIYQSYLIYLSKDPEVIKNGVYLSPSDMSLSFYIKFKI